ncbi:AIM24 family protein [Sanguibacter suaedae]|uniref:AIM24 family protein n=1 Tax=Sanguibacter suaedae TaxID=2795737 RepID=A0A934IAV3_9MICO|nr:AIM24 family protein [Sanguibacter suaedae]MBI9113484.1 AIM24 family protein [Sanguibacter suaedae]
MTMELVNSKVLKVGVQHGQTVTARKGSMLYYKGDVTFTPHSMGGGGGMPGFSGVAGMAGRMMQGEHVALMVAQGAGEVFYGLEGLYVEIIPLDGSSMLTVEADRLLAYEGHVQTSIVPLTSQGGIRGAVRGAMTGQGMFTTQVSGQGTVAVLSHGGCFPLQVGGYGGEVVVDPQAYVGHLGNITVDLSASVGFRDVVGRGSGEATQLKMSGQGTVWVQASEKKF